MKKLIGWIVGGVAVVGIAWSGQLSAKENRADAVERFSITETEHPVMRTCENRMSSNRLEFKSGVDTAFACACVAREVSDHVRSNETGAAVTFLSTLVSVSGRAGSMSPDQEDEFYTSLEEIQATYQLSDSRAKAVISVAANAISHCADPRSIETAQQTASREAALEQMKANRER